MQHKKGHNPINLLSIHSRTAQKSEQKTTGCQKAPSAASTKCGNRKSFGKMILKHAVNSLAVTESAAVNGNRRKTAHIDRNG